MADEIVDTSDMTVHELRQFFMALSRDRRARGLVITSSASATSTACRSTPTCVRRALPAESALRADAAAPTGATRGGEFMERDASTREFIDGSRTTCVRRAVLRREGKSYLTVAIGCTGRRTAR
jgi:RNase adaptor protein for sRNA GlmZ degradation